MRCAIYCRLSREDENKSDESESIHNQRLLLRQYAADRGWTVCAEYADDDRSGIDAERPGFLSLLRDAEAGRFEVLLCKTQSRFTRDLELSEHYLHRRFDEWGVRFISVVDGVDTLRRDNLKTRQLGGLIACHTTAKPAMTSMEKLLYLSDYIEPKREFPDCVKLRAEFYGLIEGRGKAAALTAALISSFDMTITGLIAERGMIHGDIFSARNYYLELSGESENHR